MDLYSRCRDQTIGVFEKLTGKALRQGNEVLLQYAEKAGSNQQQARFLEAMRQLREQRDDILERFSAALGGSFAAFQRGDDATPAGQRPAAQSEPLALVDKERFEDEIAVSMMVSRANARYAEALWKLNRRLAVLRGGSDLEDDGNPCGPRQLCTAMHRAVYPLPIDSAIKIILYKLFDKSVLARAGTFYDKLNDELAKAGILANLRHQIVREQVAAAAGAEGAVVSQQPDVEEPTAARQQQAPAESAPSIIERVDARLEARQAQLLGLIRKLQQGRAGELRTHTAGGVSYGDIATDGKPGDVDTFDERDFAFALSAVQAGVRVPTVRAAPPAPVELTEEQLVVNLRRLGSDNRHNRISTADADVIDLVGMLFKYMLSDADIPDSAKTLLSRLHTPYLKVALIDKQFFARASHPARQLLNAMAAAAARWANEGDERHIMPRIRAAVERILEEFVDDVALFDELLEEFSGYVATLEKRARLAEQRSREAQKGLDRLVVAKRRAEEEVQRRLAGARVPVAVEQLLQQPWTDFLVFNHLRHGEDSVTWHSALKVVDGVIQSLQPSTPTGRDHLRDAQQKLRRSVGDGLGAIGYNSDEASRLLTALTDAHELALAGTDPAADARDPASSPPVKQEPRHHTGSAIDRQIERQQRADTAAATLSEDTLNEAQRTILKRLKSIEFGTWFEFRRGSDNRLQRLKLAWYSSISGNYMFVNAAGVKSAVKPLAELLRGVDDGSVRIVAHESRSLVERALGAILHRLHGA